MASVVLVSSGLDSAVLLADEARRVSVHPAYVRAGLAWEAAERAMLDALLAAPPLRHRASPLHDLECSMRDVYPETHWAIRGTPPAYDSPDAAVYLAGRNLVLLTKAATLAARLDASRIVLGILAGNPFPDATPGFFDTLGRALSLGLDHPIEIAAPFAALQKHEVIRLGVELGVPLELTLSCVNPVEAPLPVHCGICGKCRERRDAFAASGLADPTPYRNAAPR